VTLGELLVATALVGLTLASLLVALDEGQRVYATGSAHVEIAQSARVALARMASDIRQAGRGARPDAFSAIAIAEVSRIAVQYDLDGDGAIAGNGETVTWQLSNGVLRRNAGGGAQPIINGVRDLVFTYLDADGQPAARPELVRSVGIRLTAAPTHTASALAATSALTLSTQVRLRNR
jgi:type II secretory pathway component PulJ